MSDKVPNLRDVIREFDNDGELEPVVRQVLEAVLRQPRKAALALLWPVVADEVRRVRRETVRGHEDDAEAAERGYLREGVDPLAARKRVLDDHFLCPGSGYVLWSEATVEQHRARAGFLSRKAGAILDTVAKHERAIAKIEAAGVECLGDIELAA